MERPFHFSIEVDIPFENMQNNVKRIFNWDWKRGVGLFT
jgi:hypothetical protein